MVEILNSSGVIFKVNFNHTRVLPVVVDVIQIETYVKLKLLLFETKYSGKVDLLFIRLEKKNEIIQQTFALTTNFNTLTNVQKN